MLPEKLRHLEFSGLNREPEFTQHVVWGMREMEANEITAAVKEEKMKFEAWKTSWSKILSSFFTSSQKIRDLHKWMRLKTKWFYKQCRWFFFNFMIQSQDPSQDRFQSSELARWNSFGTFTELVPPQILWWSVSWSPGIRWMSRGWHWFLRLTWRLTST